MLLAYVCQKGPQAGIMAGCPGRGRGATEPAQEWLAEAATNKKGGLFASWCSQRASSPLVCVCDLDRRTVLVAPCNQHDRWLRIIATAGAPWGERRPPHL